MARPFEGIRVLEVAAWTFVPAAGAVMADLGADVIKVEPPDGDPQRGLQNMLNFDTHGPNPFNEVPNRGKRSITLNLKSETGREALLAMELESSNWLIDPEILIKAHYLGLRVLELNVFARTRARGTSHVQASTCWEFFTYLLRFRFSGDLRRWRQRQVPPAAAPMPNGLGA